MAETAGGYRQGILDNGRTFDSTTSEAPLRLTIGKNEIFPALALSLIGMRPGEARSILAGCGLTFALRLHGIENA